jgi:hypothetical protein
MAAQPESNWITVVPLVFSAIALIPTLYAFVRRYLARVELIERGWVVLGFSGVGTTVSFALTLKSWRADLFVTDVRLTLTDTSSALKRDMEMLLFRSTALVSGTTHAGIKVAEEMRAEIARPFLLFQNEAKFVDIFFGGEDRFKLEKHAERLREIVGEIRAVLGPAPKAESVLSHVMNDVRAMAARKQIADEFLWSPTRYFAELVVSTSRPRKRFRARYSFELSPTDCAALKKNSEVVVSEVAVGFAPYVIKSSRLTRLGNAEKRKKEK